MKREQAIHSARVYLAEARNRRGESFFWVLLAWAASARRRAAALQPKVQLELF